ncbi:MAG: hypothetical protein Q8Q59_06735 [Luteolibacter sp.]|nr:hypothetical protein [Luteolibacter sp.]
MPFIHLLNKADDSCPQPEENHTSSRTIFSFNPPLDSEVLADPGGWSLVGVKFIS